MKSIRLQRFAWFAYLLEPEDSSLPALQYLTVGLTKIGRNRHIIGLDQAKWLIWTCVAIVAALLIAQLGP